MQELESTLDKMISNGVKLTPMMEQYHSIKKEHPETLLLFRMGDFYELFFEDAVEVSKILNIALTHRGKIGDTPIPMAGIPHHAASAYVDRITSIGKRAAICEQIEDPKEAKGIVQRAVTQIVGPGVPFDIEKLEGKESYYIASALFLNNRFALAVIDFTTGEFFGEILNSEEELCERLSGIKPKEFLTFMGQWKDHQKVLELLKQLSLLKTHLSQDYFEERFTSIYIEKLIPTYKRDATLKNFPELTDVIGTLSYYVLSTQKLEKLVQLHPFKLNNRTNHLLISATTLKGLEILPRTKEEYNDSLLGFFDRTKSAVGARTLKSFFEKPLRDKNQIIARQETIKKLIKNHALLEAIRDELSQTRDLERILAKISVGKALGSDLIMIAFSISKVASIQKMDSHQIFNITLEEPLIELEKRIVKTINNEIGASLEKGNLIKPGFHKERDKLSLLATNATDELIKLEERYRNETGISNLKVRSNNITGFFIEVSKSHANKVPRYFERRQTLVNGERYTTAELLQFEKEVITAKERLLQLEREIFKELILGVSSVATLLIELAKTIGHLDVMTTLSKVALSENFVCPVFTENEKRLEVKGAWHPLIKRRITDKFVPHDLMLDHKRYFGLITGPNMAGKTTVMREMAITVLLSQIGSFVPASEATIGISDYIFSRLGASDDIQRGHSTFMVEMSETAEIIRHATEKSLIILDEVGRGTSTYDGLSIAWALCEHLITKTKAITLFATHYHELIDVAKSSPFAKNLTVQTLSKNNKVEFLYRLIEEGASQSFGIYVASLAGLPPSILNRAQKLLHLLEKEGKKRDKDELIFEQLSIFEAPTAYEETPAKLVERELLKIDPLNITPMEALSKLSALKDLLLK